MLGCRVEAVYSCVSTGTCGVQKRALDHLELQAVLSCLMWVLGNEPESSGRAICAPSHLFSLA